MHAFLSYVKEKDKEKKNQISRKPLQKKIKKTGVRFMRQFS